MMTGYDPTKAIEIGGNPYKVLSAVLVGSVANNQSIVAGVTGKIVRVLGWDAQSSSTATGLIRFIDGSGGAGLTNFFWCPIGNSTTVANAPWSKPLDLAGYFETTVSTGLYADVATAAVNCTVYYIQYFPVT